MNDSQTPPQYLINIAGAVIAGLVTVMMTLIGWVSKRHHARTDAIEVQMRDFMPKAEITDNFATRNELMTVQLAMTEMASRKELIAHMHQQADERQRMHSENLRRANELSDRMDDVRDDLLENREVMRQEASSANKTMREITSETNQSIRDVHDRIDSVLKAR